MKEGMYSLRDCEVEFEGGGGALLRDIVERVERQSFGVGGCTVDPLIGSKEVQGWDSCEGDILPPQVLASKINDG